MSTRPPTLRTLLKRLQPLFPTPPKIALVLGSGLGKTAELLTKVRQISTTELPGYPSSSVAGHAGQILSGWWRGKAILCFSGRVHLYEGYALEEVLLGVRLARALGAEILILTNAAGGLADRITPGKLMIVTDQIDLQFGKITRGEHRTRFKKLKIERTPSNKFPSPYARRLVTLAEEMGLRSWLPVETGVLAGVLGPSYETPAEIRMLQRLGAEAVCMSTVAEAAEGNRLGMEVLGLSCITNQAAGLSGQRLQHDEVVARSQQMQKQLQGLLTKIIQRS